MFKKELIFYQSGEKSGEKLNCMIGSATHQFEEENGPDLQGLAYFACTIIGQEEKIEKADMKRKDRSERDRSVSGWCLELIHHVTSFATFDCHLIDHS